jgi:hypothetical protein
MDVETRHKWDRASRTYDFFAAVDDKRLGLEKQNLLAKARGKTLHVAAGTGNDFKFFPVGPELNRDTVGNVQKAGFRLCRVENAYLDIVKTIDAVKGGSAP